MDQIYALQTRFGRDPAEVRTRVDGIRRHAGDVTNSKNAAQVNGPQKPARTKYITDKVGCLLRPAV